MTWANLLTAIRFLIILPCAWAILEQYWLLAAGLFTLAVISDFFDGPLARRFGHASPLGGLFDHATDALFVSINLGALAWSGFVNGWLPLFVALAFLQYMLDSQALKGAILRTSFLGRNNGVAYFVLVGIPVIRNALDISWPADAWIALFGWLLLVTTLASMTERGLLFFRQRRG